MTDFFKSAFNNIFSNPIATKSSTNTNNLNSDEFVGRNIVIGNYKLKIIKSLAEGGYAIVYLAQDITSGIEYAVKRMFAADKSANKAIIDEINFLKQVNNHPYILKFIAAACEDNNTNANNNQRNEYLVLTELCKGGSLIDFIRVNELNSEQVLQLFYQISKAVQYIHNQEPSIIHRDIKIDNFLISNDGCIKLCDFGSATTIEFNPDDSWSANKRSLTEDEIAKHTTPMYRAPEMLDLYSNHPINKQADIWALGCVLFTICFNKHPFEDSAKLRIINGKYTIPQNPEFNDYHDLIRCMFNIDPRQRPLIDEVVYHLENIAESKSIKFQQNLKFLITNNKNFNSHSNINSNFNYSQNINNNPSSLHTSNATSYNNNNSDSSKWIGNAANIFKGGIKTIKEASTKVIDTMQQTINRTDTDLSYITSRLIVMSCPTEGIESTAFGNNIDLIKETIERKHSIHYTVYNLSSKNYHKEKFTKVIDVANLNSTKSPSLTIICKLCANMIKFIQQNPKNVVIIHCTDGKALSAVVTCALLLMYGVANNADSSVLIFNIKRSCSLCITPSQYRYLNYIDRLVNDSFIPLSNEFTLTGISIHSVPLFNRLKNGCTPYFEVYCKDQKVFTNFVTYEALRKYTVHDSTIHFNVNCKLYGDVTIIVYHAKSLLGGGKLTSIKICQVQFHTGFVNSNKMKFKRNELDGLDTLDKYSESFSLSVDIEMRNTNSSLANDEAWNLTNLTEYKNPSNLFSSNDEYNELIAITNASNKPYNDRSPDAILSGQSKFFLNNNNNDDSYQNYEQHEDMLDNMSNDEDHHDENEDELANKIETNLKINNEPIANLLDFDNDGDNLNTASKVEYQKQASSNSINQNTNPPKTAFDLLVDFDTESTPSEPVQQSNTATFDLFNSATTVKTNDKKDTITNLVDFSNDDDLFSFNNLNTTNASIPTITTKNSSTNNLFDPFGSFNTPLIQPTPMNTNIKPNLPQQNKTSLDPFADFGNFVSKPNTQQQQQQQPPTQYKQQTSVPNMLNLNQQKLSSNNLVTSKSTSPQESPLHKIGNYNIGSNTFSNVPAGSKPGSSTNLNANNTKPANNFNFSDFSKTAPPPGSNNTNKQNLFDTFLPGEFIKNTKQANMSLKDIKRETNSKDVDPDKLRVSEWTDGKKKNIRALLCSMDKVLWEGETKWKQVGMHELVTADQVKKAFRKAVLVVHPDKLLDHPQLNLARLIFIELNTAWEQFEQEGQKNLF